MLLSKKRLKQPFKLGLLLICIVLTGCHGAAHNPRDVVPRAVCGDGSAPETGLQGQVPLAERISGRSQQGYSCNLKLVGQYQGTGNATMGASYGHCMYSGSMGIGSLFNRNPGVQVADFSDPQKPIGSTIINSFATRHGTWETLKVHESRGILAAASVPLIVGWGYLALYDVATDCAYPKLLNPRNDNNNETQYEQFTSHEAGFSPDGMTYWVSGQVPGDLYAFDIKDPRKPRLIFSGRTGIANHGFSFSKDGNRMYLADEIPAGFSIIDVSDIQARKPHPAIRRISRMMWLDGMFTQHTIPFTYQDKPYLFVADEFDSGGVRLIDISNEQRPKFVRKYQLEINRPENADIRVADSKNNGIFGYEAHYCTLDRDQNPRWLACSWVQSGIRVFDVTDPFNPKEVAYFNPPTTPEKHLKLLNSAHAVSPIGTAFSNVTHNKVLQTKLFLGKSNMTADWCMSKPRFVGNQIWIHCDDAGAMVLEFTNGVGPQAATNNNKAIESS